MGGFQQVESDGRVSIELAPSPRISGRTSFLFSILRPTWNFANVNLKGALPALAKSTGGPTKKPRQAGKPAGARLFAKRLQLNQVAHGGMRPGSGWAYFLRCRILLRMRRLLPSDFAATLPSTAAGRAFSSGLQRFTSRRDLISSSSKLDIIPDSPKRLKVFPHRVRNSVRAFARRRLEKSASPRRSRRSTR